MRKTTFPDTLFPDPDLAGCGSLCLAWPGDPPGPLCSRRSSRLVLDRGPRWEVPLQPGAPAAPLARAQIVQGQLAQAFQAAAAPGTTFLRALPPTPMSSERGVTAWATGAELAAWPRASQQSPERHRVGQDKRFQPWRSESTPSKHTHRRPLEVVPNNCSPVSWRH